MSKCSNAHSEEKVRITENQNEDIVKLSEYQKKLRDGINSTKDIGKKRDLETKRNIIMKEFSAKLEDEDVMEILKVVDEFYVFKMVFII